MKRMTALLLAVIMVASMLPTTALATSSAPTGFRWSMGNCLGISWTDAEAEEDTTYEIRVYHGAGEDGPWTQVDSESGWEKDTAYVVQCVLWTGPGYYKVAVSRTGEDNWGESAPYLVTMQAAEGHERISAPTSGSFDAETGTLSWTDPAEGVDYEDAYYSFGHTAVVRMWYTGAEGELDKSEWTLVDKYFADGDSCSVNNFSISKLEAGVYAFSINNMAEDYGWRGQSTTLILDERYTQVEPNTPRNVKWGSGNNAILFGSWDPPVGADSHDGYGYDVAVYHSPNADGPWTSLGYYYAATYHLTFGEMSVDPYYISEYGEGYYKFAVACSATSIDGAGDWAESDVYHLDYSDITDCIAAPIEGSFDAETEVLSWTDPDDVDSGWYEHLAVVEMWYTGAEGELDQSEWTRVGHEALRGNEREMRYLNPSNLQTGRYVFTVKNLAEDYLWRGGSEAILLDGVYDYVKPLLPALDAPTGLAWTKTGVTWDIPTNTDNLGGYTLEVLRVESEDALPATGKVLDSISFGVSAEMLESGQLDMLLMEIGYMGREYIRDSVSSDGPGWFCFRVKADADDTSVNDDSAWAYSDVKYDDGTLPSAGEATNLTWNTVHMDDGTTKTTNGTISFYVEEGSRFELKVYRTDEYGLETQVDSSEGWLSEGWYHRDIFDFDGDRCQTGRYYYTIQLLGDGTTTSDGPVVTSETWSYTRPDKMLTATNLAWDTANMQLDFDLDTDAAAGVWIEFYFNGTEDNAEDANFIDSYTYDRSELPPSIPQDLFSEYGEGWYYYKVHGTSADITQAVSSWSALSPAYHYEKPDLVLSVSNLGWDGTTLTWENNFDADVPVETYQIAFYQGATEAEALAATDSIRTYYIPPTVMPWTVPANLFRTFGDGYYAYEVRVISANETIALSGDWSTRSTVYHREGPSQQAPAPADLQWNLFRNSRGTSSYYEYGTVSFATSEAVGENGQEYRVDFYRKADTATGTDVNIGTTRGWISYGRLCDSVSFFDAVDPEDLLTGTYYFTVTPIGDGVNFADGAAVTSGNWTYTRPSTELSVSNPVWNDDMSMSWTSDTTGMTHRYEVRFQYVHQGGRFYESNWNYTTEFDAGLSRFAPADEMLADYGSGTWYFQVRALPANHEQAVGSAWSSWSEGFTYSKPTNVLTAQNLKWTEDGKMTWDLGSNALSMADSYRVFFYYSPEDTTFHINNWMTYEEYSAEDLPAALPRWILQNWGIGYYAFSVMPFSADKTEALGGVQSAISSNYHHEGASTPAPQATDLLWNTYRSNNGNISREELGTVSFGVGLPDGVDYLEYKVDFYRKAETADGEDTLIGTRYVGTSSPSIKYRRVYPFDEFAHQFRTGTYYFTVTTMGDGANYKDSEPVKSAEWNYTHPGVDLTVSNPAWNDDMTMSWTEETNDLLECYEVRFQYVPQGGEFYEDNWHHAETYGPGEQNKMPPAELLTEYGTGTYYYCVRAISQELSEALHSGWTEWSEGFSYTLPTNTFKASDLSLGADGVMRWNVGGNDDLVEKYRIRLYISDSANTVFEEYDYWTSFYYSGNAASFQIPADIIGDIGPAYYSFSVLPITGDPSEALGLWSNISGSQYVGGATEAAKAPTDLQWHVERWNGEESQTRMGVSSFANPYYAGDEVDTEFILRVYRKDAAGDVLVGETNTRTNQPYVTFNVFERANQRMISGNYYFTVYTVGDGIHTANSELAVSETWTYNRPAAELQVSAPVWNDDMTMSWTNGDLAADRYRIRFQYVPEGGSFNPGRSHGTMTWSSNTGAPAVPEWLLEEKGEGTYYFQVQAHSADVTAVAPSNWSAWSAGYVYPPVEEEPVLVTPSAPVWIESEAGMQMGWTYNGETPTEFQIDIQRVAENGALNPDEGFFILHWSEGNPATLPYWVTEQYSEGSYHFRVRAAFQTEDAATVTDWSDWSDGWVYDIDHVPSAKIIGKNVLIEAELPEYGVSTTYMCVLYSAEGQMLGMTTIEPESEDGYSIRVEDGIPEGVYLTIFAVDTGAGWTVPNGLQPIQVPIQ